MQIRVFTVDENGFIKIRPEDFELLLNDAYMEGYSKNSLITSFQEPKEPPKDAVYPTWGEWLISVGAARKIPTGVPFELQDGRIVDSPWETVVDVDAPIPADIAEKLGIQPKEG